MTKVWGPLGWATLHSIAALYPNDPSELEKAMLLRWIDAFQKTIVCEKCKHHFEAFLYEYRLVYPNWYNSRKEMTLMVLRAHNAVNARISKPVYSVQDCISLLRHNVVAEKANLMRQSYILFIRRDWSRDTTLGGISTAKYIKDIVMTETDYWSTRTFNWDDIEQLVNGENIEPASQPIRPPTFSLPKAPTNMRPLSALSIANTTKPRFSFLSR